MSIPTTIKLTKIGKDGGQPGEPGCWSCVHSRVCSLRRAWDDLLHRHLDFVEVDHQPRHTWVAALIGEICKRWEGRP